MADSYETLCNVLEDNGVADTVATIANILDAWEQGDAPTGVPADKHATVAAILRETVARLSEHGVR